jgi:hypothetical protein
MSEILYERRSQEKYIAFTWTGNTNSIPEWFLSTVEGMQVVFDIKTGQNSLEFYSFSQKYIVRSGEVVVVKWNSELSKPVKNAAFKHSARAFEEIYKEVE